MQPEPGTVADFIRFCAFLAPCFAALALWNWWHWRER